MKSKIVIELFLFTLICLVIIIYYPSTHLKIKQSKAIRLFVFDSSLLNKNRFYSSLLFEPLPPKRNYINIVFLGNDEDTIKLKFAQTQIHKIISQKDTINGIKFSYTNTCQFGTYFKTVDILQTENAKRYIPINDDIWFMYIPDKAEKESQIRSLDL